MTSPADATEGTNHPFPPRARPEVHKEQLFLLQGMNPLEEQLHSPMSELAATRTLPPPSMNAVMVSTLMFPPKSESKRQEFLARAQKYPPSRIKPRQITRSMEDPPIKSGTELQFATEYSQSIRLS